MKLPKLLFSFFLVFTLLTVVSATVDIIVPVQDRVTVNTYTGNLTNISQMVDVNVPAPNNAEVLTWSAVGGTWISSAGVPDVSWIANWTAYNTSWSSGADNDTLVNYIAENNASVNNYILENNGTIENYILE
ncbi:unnamed protein product, partial [marine sediment metagenome]